MNTLNLECIRNICDNLSDRDFISLGATCWYMTKTIENDIDYLIQRCQKSLDTIIKRAAIDNNTLFYTGSKQFTLDQLFENILVTPFLNLKQFPWKWFLLKCSNATIDNGNIIIGTILSEDAFKTQMPYNKVFYIASHLVCIGIQCKTDIMGLHICSQSSLKTPRLTVKYIADKYANAIVAKYNQYGWKKIKCDTPCNTQTYNGGCGSRRNTPCNIRAYNGGCGDQYDTPCNTRTYHGGCDDRCNTPCNVRTYHGGCYDRHNNRYGGCNSYNECDDPYDRDSRYDGWGGNQNDRSCSKSKSNSRSSSSSNGDCSIN